MGSPWSEIIKSLKVSGQLLPTELPMTVQPTGRYYNEFTYIVGSSCPLRCPLLQWAAHVQHMGCPWAVHFSFPYGLYLNISPSRLEYYEVQVLQIMLIVSFRSIEKMKTTYRMFHLHLEI